MTLKASIIADRDFVIAPLDRRVFGTFVEHMGRCVYGGIYEPGHPTADEHGFRGDVLALTKELGVTIVRYPGGNFLSGYDWEDGVGPKDQRPVKLDLAWFTTETNQFGTNEFITWCRKAEVEPMFAVNLGTRGPDEARHFLEYCNHPGGTYYSELRKSHGYEQPHDIKFWCLGNEMDGPWQIGHKTADEYGRLAHETAKALRSFDKSLELVVCGSSNAKMPTYPEWEATVLDHTYNEVDYISLHMYFDNHANDTANYLAMSEKLDDYIMSVAGVIDYIKAKKRSTKQVYISFDEWNVWYHSKEQDKKILEGNDGWPSAPPLLEDIYNFEDVLQVGLILNTFIRRSNVVKIACLAQLVNVIAPIMTVPNGPAWRQTTYYPFLFACVYGRGKALDLKVASPTYKSDVAGDVAYADIAGVHDEACGHVTFFAVNRHANETAELDIGLEGFGSASLVDHQVMTHADLRAVNSAEKPDNVVPKPGSGAAVREGRLSLTLPPYSYQMIRIKI